MQLFCSIIWDIARMHKKTAEGKLIGVAIAILILQTTLLSVNFLVRAQGTDVKNDATHQNATVSQQAELIDSGETAKNNDLYTVEGKATFYAHMFHNRKTASGERYNMHNFSAAHRTLPFGTILRVTNPSTNRSVLVRINDRGPFRSKKIIDLSLASAREIGLKGSPTVILEGFIPGSISISSEMQEKYVMAFSETSSPVIMPVDNVEFKDSVKSFQNAVEIYRELVSKNDTRLYYIFAFTSEFIDKRRSNANVVFYVGSSKRPEISAPDSKSLVQTKP